MCSGVSWFHGSFFGSTLIRVFGIVDAIAMMIDLMNNEMIVMDDAIFVNRIFYFFTVYCSKGKIVTSSFHSGSSASMEWTIVAFSFSER